MVVLRNIFLICIFGFLLCGLCLAQRDQNGLGYELNRLGEGLTILDFAASWCGPCWKALPKMEAFAKQRPDLRIWIVSEDETPAGRDQLVKKLGLTLPVIWDKDHRWAEKLDPAGMPSTMILDGYGNVVYQHTGYNKSKWQLFLKAVTRLIPPP